MQTANSKAANSTYSAHCKKKTKQNHQYSFPKRITQFYHLQEVKLIQNVKLSIHNKYHMT